MTMHDYLIVPQAPPVFRSGRPFGVGSRDGAGFPWPSSLAGMVRTETMDERGWQPPLSTDQINELRAIPVAGPLLARRQGNQITPLCPKPADALLLRDEADDSLGYHRLTPGPWPPGCGGNLPPELLPLHLATQAKGKPQPGPAFWTLAELCAWRAQGHGPDPNAQATLLEPARALRTHVGIDRETFGTEPGRLFQTESLDLAAPRKPSGRGFETADWVFLARTKARLTPRAVVFGGERRPSRLEPLDSPALAPPPGYLDHLATARHLVITLLTPALFTSGWQPGWLEGSHPGGHPESNEDNEDKEKRHVPGIPGLKLRLRAAAVERWQGISGWDLAAGGPKPARKAVPAGAVYWFDILGEPPADWAQKLWLAPLADDPQDQHDGFGLALPGPWPHPPL